MSWEAEVEEIKKRKHLAEQMGGEAVPQHVRGDVADDSRGAATFLDARPQRHCGELGAPRGQEYITG